jgi:hypothetical protein
MRFFLHTLDRVRIISGDQEWTGTPAEFQILEPDYPGLPTLDNATAVTRYQTNEWKYVEDSLGAKHPDSFNALVYCDNIGNYTPQTPCIFVHCAMAKALLCASDPEDTIPFTASIRSGPLETDSLIPISAIWPIMLRQKNGLAMDNILVEFVNGEFAGAYTYNQAQPLGEWYLDEQDFAQVTMGEITYQVKLADPVRFTIYRNL